MIKIAKTDFSIIYFDKELSIMELHWINQESEEMQEKHFKEGLLLCLELVQINKPSSFLLNSELLTFPIVPELQEWADENISLPTTEIIKKMAVVMPKTLVEQLSMEQVFDEKEAQKYETQFFGNYQQAFDWLTIKQ